MGTKSVVDTSTMASVSGNSHEVGGGGGGEGGEETTVPPDVHNPGVISGEKKEVLGDKGTKEDGVVGKEGEGVNEASLLAQEESLLMCEEKPVSESASITEE